MKMLVPVTKLHIPKSKAQRDKIREYANNYIKESGLVTPVAPNMLQNKSKELLREYNLDHINLSFAMVCLGNALWREQFGAIPFHKRILVLPECLSNSECCNADRDSIGLICNECGKCSITEIQHYAEKLGYITVVSEGTTVPKRLIESGKVDAIIGVGCMEVLQKMNILSNQFAIPGIGIPLLKNGCKDTVTDVSWLKMELSVTNNFPTAKGNYLFALKNKVQALFEEEHIKNIINGYNLESERIAIYSVISSGQRWRPLLTSLVYGALSNKPDNDVSAQLAIAVECFHKASLIHDDIEDDDIERNGEKTLHTLHGVPIAINTGDLLTGLGYRILSNCKLNAEEKTKCIQVASSGHYDLSLGQGEELLAGKNSVIPSFEKMLMLYELKTSAAFRVSLLTGAVAANASQVLIGQLKKISKYLGIAYQIKDDIADFYGEKGDILLRHFSILLSLLKDKINTNENRQLQEIINQKQSSLLYSLIDKYDIKQKTLQLLKENMKKTIQNIDLVQEENLKTALHEVFAHIFRAYL